MQTDNSSIILVEDNESDAEVARRALDRASLAQDLMVIVDGLAAAELLLGSDASKPIARPRVLLIDINLPGLNGLELLKRIRNAPHLRRVPVVMVSSSMEVRDICEAYDSGCNSYVTKPVEIRALQAMYTSVAGYWTRLNLAEA